MHFYSERLASGRNTPTVSCLIHYVCFYASFTEPYFFQSLLVASQLLTLTLGMALPTAVQALAETEAADTEAAIEAATQAVEQWLPLVDADSFGTA